MYDPAQDEQPVLLERVGDYRLHGMVGRGAAGIVYRGRRQDAAVGDAETVAVKVLDPDAARSPQALACFQFEGRVLTRLDHPGIMRVFETGMDDGYLFTVMELISGQSLEARLLGGKRLPVHQAADLARQCAEALHYLHQAGYVHRDIKPANLLLTPEGRIVLFDFGTAVRIRDSLDYETGLYGTPAFLAPEQIQRGQPIDGRADLYALGIVLYQMATGRKPFYGSRESVLQAHLATPPPPPSGFARVPAPLEAVILRAIAKDPDERYASGADMAQALADVAAHLPPPPPSLWQRLRAWLPERS